MISFLNPALVLADPVTPGKVCTTLEISKLLPGLDLISSAVNFCTLKGVSNDAALTVLLLPPINTSFNVTSWGNNSIVLMVSLPELTTTLYKV